MSDQQMVFHHNWDDEEELINHLANEAYFGRLTFALGAGLSSPFGLAEWEGLVAEIESANTIRPNPKFDLPRRAEFVLSNVFQDDDSAFASEVRTRLYKGFSPGLWDLRANRTLSGVASLAQCIALATRTAHLITLNFDDLLEEYLRQHGFPCESVTTPDGGEVYSPVHVLHPHGMLPANSLDAGTSVVFDRRSFSRIISDQDGWRPKLIEALKGKTALLIGLSGLDDHLDSLLTRVADLRVRDSSRSLQLPYWAVWLSTRTDGSEQTALLLRRRGVFTKFVEDYENALPAFLFDICTAIGLRNSR